ncbi:TMEM165/GDT1 family protein [Roseomonas sp. E05]|uniref:COG4280 domain-containing protein n=1 Tax=Roseomonas sp. E05 TaxID=3046310 RepID=UPI0024BA31AC|nr:TMEM165/GDT1 family protein [Roseomonas sp. E05]MDJ0390283.1 TMEM165/GDT1 family protein [Roseomonas sp. E05]
MTWLEAGPTLGAAFLASLVECVEAATIVLAVGTVRGWRSGLAGTALGLVVLAALVVALGPALARAPEHLLQTVVGLLLLLFGMRWLRKAILRAAGIIPLHDEEAVFRSETANLRLARVSERHGVDPLATVTAFKAVLLEGVEVVFIVLAVSAGGRGLLPVAAAGALAAALLVVAMAVAVHRPLARVPENTLKFAVGVVISAFGIYWSGEGLGIAWPGQDLALPVIAGGLLAFALLSVRLAARPVPVEVR